jgi:hypothetical protein
MEDKTDTKLSPCLYSLQKCFVYCRVFCLLTHFFKLIKLDDLQLTMVKFIPILLINIVRQCAASIPFPSA